MRRMTCRYVVLAAAVATLAAMLGGCAGPDSFVRVEVGRSDGAAVKAALGAEAQKTAVGATQEVQQGWPTVIHLVHVAIPEGGLAQWKLQLTGRVTHWILYQSLSVDVVYEGPISQVLEDGLRVSKSEQDSEYGEALVRFVREKTNGSLSGKWTHAATVSQDRYRSRMLGLLESSLQDLRGRGRLSRQRYGAEIQASGSSLVLRSMGSGSYRIEMHGGATLGPSPIL